MKTLEAVQTKGGAVSRARLADYAELTKPRISVLVLFTVAAGFLLGRPPIDAAEVAVLLHVLCGTALVAAGASVLNQYYERDVDALMRRTENRPLPTGRVLPLEAFLLGLFLGVGGLTYLAVFVQKPLCVAVAALTYVSYVWIYTPLKRYTTLNTIVGAVPGALPPVIGWTAAHDTLTFELGVLFLVLFLWQVPHFLAIAWIYRGDYESGGLRMLPVLDRAGRATGRQMVLYCVCLTAVSLLPWLYGYAGGVYLAGAAVAGGAFTCAGVRFARQRTRERAKVVLRTSLLYLPALLLLQLFCVHPRGW